jgi:hypothetical protein
MQMEALRPPKVPQMANNRGFGTEKRLRPGVVGGAAVVFVAGLGAGCRFMIGDLRAARREAPPRFR